MNQEQVKNNLLAPSQWVRILLMAGFLLAVWVLSLVLLVVMITQMVTVLIAGEANPNLQRFGAQSSLYLKQIVDFLVYSTEYRPFPFAPFPETGPAPAATYASTDHVSPEPAPVADPYPHAQPADQEFEPEQPVDPDEDKPASPYSSSGHPQG